GLRVSGAEDRHQLAPGAVVAVPEAARECVQLADRALEVFLANLVVSGRHASPIGRLACMSLRLHQDLRPVARRTRRSREARRAGAGMALVCRNFSAWT